MSVVARGLSHAYGELRSLDSIELEARPRRGRRPGRAVRLRQVDPAGDRLRAARAERRDDRGRRRDRRRRAASPTAPTCPSATSSCPGSRRSTTRRWRCATAASARPRRAPRRARSSSASASPGSRAARPQELSGGMRQRVAFLRTLVAGKPVLLLDEPFASLDAISRAEMQEWLAGTLRADGRTVLLVSHDLEEALYLADRVLVLSARPGRVVKELRAPDPRAADRDGAVTDPEFVAAREAALRALRDGTATASAPALAGGRDERARRPPRLLPVLVIAALIGALADRRLDRLDRRSARPRTVPRPLPGRSRRRALEQPLGALGKHLGDAAGDPDRARRRRPRRHRPGGGDALLPPPARRRLPAQPSPSRRSRWS